MEIRNVQNLNTDVRLELTIVGTMYNRLLALLSYAVSIIDCSCWIEIHFVVWLFHGDLTKIMLTQSNCVITIPTIMESRVHVIVYERQQLVIVFFMTSNPIP